MREKGEPGRISTNSPPETVFQNNKTFQSSIIPFNNFTIFFKLIFRFIKKIDKPYVLRDKNIIKKELN